MIWFTIALFVVSFLVSALLAPKPDIENARASSLEDVQFPRATENAPIPLVLGKVRNKAPNTLYYGGFRSKKIKKKVKTGLFSSKNVTLGHEYFLTLDLGLSIGECALHEVFIDDESVWTGNMTSSGLGSISAGSLFGGYKEGGGWKGSFRFYTGSFTESVNAAVESLLGSGNVPAYRGMTRVVFEDCNIGESAQLRKMAFVQSRYTNDLNLSNAGRVGDDDLNPMEALYQVFVDPWAGLGIDPALIEVPSLVAAGETLFAEGNGCSVIVTSQAEGKKVVKEILRQIDAILYQDTETGKINVRLIRNDYDVADLDQYGEDEIIAVKNFTKTAWEDVISEIRVGFSSRDKDTDRVALSQDMATIGMLGRRRSSQTAFPFVYDADLANDIASRERAQQSVPLFRMQLEMNRRGFSLRPGQPFVISWPEYGLENLVMRVQKIDLGALLKNRIIVDCIQDSFAIGTTVFAPPADTGWVPPITLPQPLLVSDAVPMPYFYTSRLESPVSTGFDSLVLFALKPDASASAYDALLGIATNELDFNDPIDVEYFGSGLLNAEYPADAGLLTGVDTAGFVLTEPTGDFPSGFSTSDIRAGESGIIYMGGEWLGYTTAVVATNATITNVYRGLFGSQIKTHPVGTRAWVFSIETLAQDISSSAVEGSTVFYKLLNKIGPVAEDQDDVTEQLVVLPAGGFQDRPARPRNVQINGAKVGVNLTGNVDVPITWSSTDRTSAGAALETDPTEVPDQTETYDVDVFIAGVLEPTLSSTGVTSPYTMPVGTYVGTETNCEVRVTSRRTVGNLRTSTAYGWVPFAVDQS